jgi:hypothetical protein
MDHAHAGVPNRGNNCVRVVSGRLVDDDHFQIDVLLSQYAAQRHGKQGAAIARRYDDGYFQ